MTALGSLRRQVSRMLHAYTAGIFGRAARHQDSDS